MAIATDAQMQSYMDQRLRPRAEQARQLVRDLQDDVNSIADEFSRSSSGPLWGDARTDGPPHLLASGPTSSPDDLSNYNALAATLLAVIAGTATANQITSFPGQWAIFQRACVRPAS